MRPAIDRSPLDAAAKRIAGLLAEEGIAFDIDVAGVNIVTFHLGRAEQGADAIALLELDAPIAPEVLQKVRALLHINRAEALHFGQVAERAVDEDTQ